MPNSPRNIIVHHSAATGTGPQFRDINQWHKERDFPLSELGFYVGYHWVVEKDGAQRRARFDHEIGAHTIGHNEHSIGICLAGNFDTELPTAEQIRSLGVLLAHYCEQYKLTEHDIQPHRAFKATSCYGAKLDEHWAARVYLMDRINDYQVRLGNLPVPNEHHD